LYHFVDVLGKLLVIKMAMRVDQLHVINITIRNTNIPKTRDCYRVAGHARNFPGPKPYPNAYSRPSQKTSDPYLSGAGKSPKPAKPAVRLTKLLCTNKKKIYL